MCIDDCRATLTLSCRAKYKAERMRSLRSGPKTSVRARLETSALDASTTTLSSISACSVVISVPIMKITSSEQTFPLIPDTLKRSSPMSVIEACYKTFNLQRTIK
jgi:hypothetical protein